VQTAVEQWNAEAVRLGAEFRKGAESTQGCGKYANAYSATEGKSPNSGNYEIPKFRPRKVSARIVRDSDNLAKIWLAASSGFAAFKEPRTSINRNNCRTCGQPMQGRTCENQNICSCFLKWRREVIITWYGILRNAKGTWPT
jgi:hypothetical protein